MDTLPSAVIARAAELHARRLHAGQDRNKTQKTPLIQHVEEVVDFMLRHGGTDVELALAWLHDAVEDTDETLEGIAGRLGPEFAALLAWLTDPDIYEAMPLAERKAAQAIRVRSAPAAVQRVKVADQTSNVAGMMAAWPADWKGEGVIRYCDGARAVVASCAGSCTAAMLDEFEEACAETIAYHRSFISGGPVLGC